MRDLEMFLQESLELSESLLSSNEDILYKHLYSQVSNEKLRKIFSILHARLNHLFELMNERIQPFLSGGNYLAAPSRELINIIKEIPIIKANLQDTELRFEVNEYYDSVMKKCKEFLKSSNGSIIPHTFEKIDLLIDKPIFTINMMTEVKGITEKAVPVRYKGGGSYAHVYVYKDPHYKCNFAIKRAKTDLEPKELTRFKEEFKDMHRLDSPFILKAYRYNDVKNEYVMEYVEQTLDSYISKNNNILPLEKRKMLISQLLKGFQYIHSQDLLHRDISYTNILVKEFDDGTPMIKISDFGLVKRLNSLLTSDSSAVKGSINDYSDLSSVGFKEYEIRHETYALAKVIYFILTGKKTNYYKEKNDRLREFVIKAISDKEKRFTSVDEMREELKKVYRSYLAV